MITSTDINRAYYPEIGDRCIEDSPAWHLLVDPIRWGALHILMQHRAKIKISVFLILLLL